PLIPTFIASKVSLIVSSSRTPTVTGKMANSVALVTFGITRTIMVIVSFRAQWLRSLIWLLLPRPCKCSASSFAAVGDAIEGASSKLNLVLDCTITDIEDSFGSFKPLSYTNNSFSTLEVHGLTFEKVSVTSRAANASIIPWSIYALSWAFVTGVVVVVVAGDALVVFLVGAIFFKL
nr:hypothetical protein [Tanacetum cinerariifolium]